MKRPRTSTTDTAPVLPPESAARKIVLRHAAALVKCGTMQAAAEVMFDLYGDLYRLAAEEWQSTATPARDLSQRIWDGKVFVTSAAIGHFRRALAELTEADRDSVLPPHLKDYLRDIISLLRVRLGMTKEELPARVAHLWPQPWLIDFDYYAKSLTLEYASGWTPPPSKKPKRPMIGSGVIRERESLWLRVIGLRMELAKIGKSGKPSRKELSKERFALDHGVSVSEFTRWFQPTNGIAEGTAPDKSYKRALNAEIDKLERTVSHG